MPTEAAEDVAPGARPAKPLAAQELQYDKTSGVTRRQINLFILLGFLNTFLFAAFICLPSASPFLKQMWTDWQASRARARSDEKDRAIVAACMNHVLPPDQLVYAEPAADAERLLASAGRARTLSDRPQRGGGGGGGGGLFGGPGRARGAFADLLPPADWREPVVFAGTAPLTSLTQLDALRSGPSGDFRDDSLVFLHARKTPSGKPRLAWVSVDAEQTLHKPEGDGSGGNPHEIETTRRLTAHVFDPGDLASATKTTIEFVEPRDRRSRGVFEQGDDGVRRAKSWEPRGLWRIRAGQPDAGDPTLFTIPYDVDGTPGVIDGRLNDGDRVLLTPRSGRLIGWTSSTTYTWDLAAPPATRPSP